MTAAAEIASGRVWRPYDDDPLITQDMVNGLDDCDPEARERLLVYLEAVVAHRAAPVHTTVAFNALYFGYDVEAGGYVGGPLDFGDFPSVARGDRSDALPVGAMINIRTGGDLLPAEIVYKEGAHPELDPYGGTPGWISGAPSGARGPALLAPDEAPSLDERLVFDSAAFGQGMAPTSERLQRLRRQGRTDSFGHLLVESSYEFADADLSDTDYYARYLVTRGRDQLTSALAPTPLPLLLAPGSSDDELMAAVRGLMGTVRQALASLDAARVWGEYAFTRASMAQRLGDSGPLGRSDLVRLAESTASQAVPRAGRRAALSERPVYTALGPVLRDRPEWQDAIRGTGYPLAVCHANSVLADYARREHDETTGLLASGVRLSLDDRWQGGGVWRAVLATGRTDEPRGGFTDEPAGRGWAESFPQPPARGPDIAVQLAHLRGGEAAREADAELAGSAVAPVVAPAENPANRGELAQEYPDGLAPPVSADGGIDGGTDSVTGGGTDDDTEGSTEGSSPDAEAGPLAPGPLWPDDSDLGAPLLPAAQDSQAEWQQPLRLAHVMQEYLPIPGHIGDEFLPVGTPVGLVRVVLNHAGVKLPAAEACHDARVTAVTTGTRLDGIAWPLDFFPGIWLSFTWQRGSNVIHARTTLLPQPVTVDGELIEHRYDPMVLTRDGSTGLPAGTEPTEDLPPHQLLTAIRRLGLLDQFGQAMLARQDVPAAVNAVMGGVPVEASRIETALTGLLTTQHLTTARGSQSEEGHTHHPPQPGESIVQLVCYRPHRIDVKGSQTNELDQQASARPDQPVQLHGVAGFLRRIGHLGHEATDEQRTLYREDHRRFRLSGPAELPHGFTYVRPHKRGR
ncbi:hypothetical protein [Streptomyces sp. SID2888]|uniref:hypothetical protein n=1 Tax=Streptomyces TaxID=1883 RepID=UPI00136E75D1|nr:hypothetical protein [Streptomyces sp. SID2888]MYV45126.1 hypothetical protein [Streptomyces sp. SID2888]